MVAKKAEEVISEQTSLQNFNVGSVEQPKVSSSHGYKGELYIESHYRVSFHGEISQLKLIVFLTDCALYSEWCDKNW